MMKMEELTLTQDWDCCHRSLRTLRRCQGTVQRTLCADHGRERIPHGRL